MSGPELKRDYYFEFSGMSKSGKSTLMEIVMHALKREGYKVREFHGGGRYEPIDKEYWDNLNVFLASKVSQYLLLTASRERVYNRLFFLDRGIFDRIIFLETVSRLGKLNQQTKTAAANFLLDKIHVDKIDAVFLCVTSPELSLERENKNKIIKKDGRVMNNDFLHVLRTVSLECFQNYQGVFSNMHLIDTEKRDGEIVECATEVHKLIHGIIEAG